MALPDEVARKPGLALADHPQESPQIGPYEQSPATCNDHDPRAIQVAEQVGSPDRVTSPGIVVEHVGSTAVPGCAGKGVVDLMVLYPPGQLPEVRDGLDALGFQRQTGRDPFPEERPMRIGSIEYDGTRFRLHVHVIASDSPKSWSCGPSGIVCGAIRRSWSNTSHSSEGSSQRASRIRWTIRSARGSSSLASSEAETIPKVNIREKLALFHDHWSPKIVGELNGQHVKLVKFQGEFVWHKHDHEDELFLVVKGRFRMEYRDRHVWLEEGEFLIVPRGVEHRPVAEEEVHVLLFEPAGTLNTGDVRG